MQTSGSDVSLQALPSVSSRSDSRWVFISYSSRGQSRGQRPSIVNWKRMFLSKLKDLWRCAIDSTVLSKHDQLHLCDWFSLTVSVDSLLLHEFRQQAEHWLTPFYLLSVVLRHLRANVCKPSMTALVKIGMKSLGLQSTLYRRFFYHKAMQTNLWMSLVLSFIDQLLTSRPMKVRCESVTASTYLPLAYSLRRRGI